MESSTRRIVSDIHLKLAAKTSTFAACRPPDSTAKTLGLPVNYRFGGTARCGGQLPDLASTSTTSDNDEIQSAINGSFSTTRNSSQNGLHANDMEKDWRLWTAVYA